MTKTMLALLATLPLAAFAQVDRNGPEAVAEAASQAMRAQQTVVK